MENDKQQIPWWPILAGIAGAVVGGLAVFASLPRETSRPNPEPEPPPDPDEPLYHVAFVVSLDSIADEGLLLGRGNGLGRGGGTAEYSRGKIFLTSAEGVRFWYGRAEDWANNDSDNPYDDGLTPVVLRVSGVSEYAEPDELGSRDAGFADAFYVTDEIASEDIEVYAGPKHGWVPIEQYGRVDAWKAYNVEVDAHDEDDEDEDEEEAVYITLLEDSENPLFPPELLDAR